MADRPLLVAIIAILTIIVGLLVLIAGAALFGTDLGDIGGLDLEGLGNIFGAGFIIAGLIYLIIGIGLWQGWKIIWYIAVILYILSLIISILALPAGIISIIITIIILWYLFRPNVKAFFKIGG
jgi:hypothetical protein